MITRFPVMTMAKVPCGMLAGMFALLFIGACSQDAGRAGPAADSLLDLPYSEAFERIDRASDADDGEYMAQQWMLARSVDRQELKRDHNKLQAVVRLGSELQLRRPEYRAEVLQLLGGLAGSADPGRRQMAALNLDIVPGELALGYLWILAGDPEERVAGAALQSIEQKVRLRGFERHPTPPADIADITARIDAFCARPVLSEQNREACHRIALAVRD